MKPRIFKISIDSSLNIFSSSFSHLLQIIETTIFFENVYFRVCEFSILTANNAVHFFLSSSLSLSLLTENVLVLL